MTSDNRKYNAIVLGIFALELVAWYFLWSKVVLAPHLEEHKLFKALATTFTFAGAALLSHYALASSALVEKWFPRLAGLVVGILGSGLSVAALVGVVTATPNGAVLCHFGMMGFFAVVGPLHSMWENGLKRGTDSLAKVRGFGFCLVIYGQGLQMFIAITDVTRA